MIRLNRHWLDFGISAAAAVILFFCFSYLAMTGTNNNSDTVVAAFPTIEKVAVKSNTPNTKPAKSASAKTGSVNAVSNQKADVTSLMEPVKQEPTKAAPANEGEKYYVIVLATYVSQDNAERFIKSLSKEGLDQARYVKNGKVSRILYSEYANEESAQKDLNSLRQQNPAFAEAWILEL